MSKKLLASLIALTMLSAFACGDDDKKDDKGGASCTLGEMKCTDGATAIEVCNSKGQWIETTCADFKPEVTNGVCQSNNCVTQGTTPPTPTGDCTDGTYQCSGQFLQQCVNKAWQTAKTCFDTQVCDADLKDCKDKENPGPGPQPGKDDCSASSTAECNGVCVDDTTGYYWKAKDNKVETVSCTAPEKCTNDNGFIKCGDGSTTTLEACAMTKDADCTKCQAVCAADGAHGYYCNTKTGKMVEKTCKDNVCSVDGNTLNCDSDSQSTDTGKTCEAGDKTKTCVGDNTVEYCSNGKVLSKTCNSCTLNAAGTYYCCDGDNAKCEGSSEPLEDCAMTKDADCTKCQVVCAADGAHGYYCNTKTGKMVEKACKDNVCSVDGNTLKCDNAGSSEPLDNCEMKKDADCTKCQVVCTTDGSKGYYCNTKTGKMVEKTCKDNVCSVDGNTLNCENAGGNTDTGKTCAADDKTKTCVDANTVEYCSGGKVYSKTCTSCMLNAEGTYYCCDGNNDKCTGEDTRPDCTATSTATCKGKCKADKTEGYYWSSGKVVVVKCDKKDCSDDGGYVACGEQEACKADTYQPSCSDDNTYALYCSSSEIVKKYTCKDGTACVLRTDGKCTVESTNCVSGKYDKEAYPKGYFECAPK